MNIFLGIALALAAVLPAKVKTLYSSLDKHSLTEQLAFYELYPETTEGKKALQQAASLLHTDGSVTSLSGFSKGMLAIDAIISLVNKPPGDATRVLTEEEAAGIDRLAAFLPNRKLKGFHAKSEQEVLALPAEEIDLARALLLSELGTSEQAFSQIRSYEASLDLMALQILTHVSLDAAPKEKIRAINRFIFSDMRFRFPAHSTHTKEIDLYTFLPSVLDSRKGVCLGVSLLYMCLAERLNLNLEMITPPGHIFVRYRNGDTIINIETTARGIHLDTKEYLGIDTRSLTVRSVKQVIGMAHFNQASVFWERGLYGQAVDSYRHALLYAPGDPLITELLGYNLILNGELEEGAKQLEKIKDHLPDYAINKETIAEDYLNGKTDAAGLAAVFMRVDETRGSLLKKRDALVAALDKFPEFRGGLFALASTHLQLQREVEALAVLERYLKLSPEDAAAAYYLAVLYAKRMDYNKAWDHLLLAEHLVKQRDHDPVCLHDLKNTLSVVCPK